MAGGSEPHEPGAKGSQPRPKQDVRRRLIFIYYLCFIIYYFEFISVNFQHLQMVSFLRSIINKELNSFQSFQAITVGHACDVIADGSLETIFFDEVLKIAGHTFGIFTEVLK